MQNVWFDFHAAEQCLEQTEDIIQRLNREVLSGVQDITQQIPGAWNGEAGSRIYAVTEKEMEKIKQTENLLKKTSLALQEAIVSARKIEEKTKEIAEVRNY